MCIILFKVWDGPKTCVLYLHSEPSCHSWPVGGDGMEGRRWRCESRWSNPRARWLYHSWCL